MVMKKELIKEKAATSGIFDFKGIYNFAHSWLKEEKKYGVTEDKYSEKVSGDSKDIVIEWTSVRQMSDYFVFEIKTKFEINGMSDVEVEIDGKKKEMNKGKIEMELKGNLVRDPESTWDKNPITRFFRDIYNKYVIPARIDTMEDKLRAHVGELKDQVKEFMDLTGKR